MGRRKVSDFSIEQKTFAPPLDQIEYSKSGLIPQYPAITISSFASAHCRVHHANIHKIFPLVILAKRNLKSYAYTGIPRWSTT